MALFRSLFGTEKGGIQFLTTKAIGYYLEKMLEEASENTKKMFRNMCSYYEVPMYTYGSKDDLGHSMGKEFRASLAITEEGFAKSIEKRLIEAERIAEVAE